MSLRFRGLAGAGAAALLNGDENTPFVVLGPE
jgi:hypothetical protein